MADIAIIIGNGFDIDMGLPSRYSDFVKSKEWQDLVSGIDRCFPEKSYHDHSLIWQLRWASGEPQWFDIEEEIHKFIIAHPENKEDEIKHIRNEFDLLKKALKNYIQRISENFKAEEKKLGYLLLTLLQDSPMTILEIIFNYTYPGSFLKGMAYYKTCWVTPVHGSLKEDDIVLGCDLQPGEKVNRQLSFMYKYNMLKKTNHIARHLLAAKEIIFFGHSVNEMDFRYFKAFFQAAAQAPQPIRHLTFFTYDEESERSIKDNIQNQGISVTDLYSNLFTFSFIHTQKYYQGDEKEVEAWKDLMQRLLTQDRQGI